MKACALSDAESLYTNYTSNIDASRFLQRTHHHEISRTQEFINNCGEQSWFNGSNKYAWSIFEHNNTEVIGIFLLQLTDDNVAEIHFGLSPCYWGHGYIAEAGLSILNWIKTNSSISKVYTYCDIHHYRSIRVLEKMGLERTHTEKKFLRLPNKSETKEDAYFYAWYRDKI